MWDRFKQDALRWVVPGEIAEPTVLTWTLLVSLLFRYPALRATAWYRLACWCRANRIPFMVGTIHRWLFFRFGLEIAGDIEGGLYLAHPVGTVMNVSHMGRNCSIIAAVTIGMRNTWAFPVIGDGVFIGAGARILGELIIGDYAKIGANAVVLQDIPAHATAVGVPARVLNRAAAYGLLDETHELAYTNTEAQAGVAEQSLPSFYV